MRVEIITLLIRLGILIVTGFVAPAAKAWLQEQAEESKWGRVKQWAYTAVQAAEQQYKDYAKTDPDGTKRKELAVKVLRLALDKAGINLGADEINAVIESAVLAV